MKKRLSAYWWCQLAGWGLFMLILTFFYITDRSFVNFKDFSSIVITTVSGLFISHVMRLFIIKAKLLDLRIWKQLIFVFLITFIFSFIYLIFEASVEFLREPGGFKSEHSFWGDLLFGILLNSQFLFIWNLIYFSYHYIEKSRKQQIDKVRLENELKFQQLESATAQAQLQQQATELEMRMLRAQMNPHFIFNSLNSINRFILQKNSTQASEYLTKFSRLMRMILQNSQAPLISLESELESLELYLNLEVLRFDHHFDYKISVADDLDVSEFKLPPLVIQPYVENAIWHGLMQKEEKGQLGIDVSQEGSYLYLRVVDNGIGRKKAAELASKSATRHKSMGLKITADRIAMMRDGNSNDSFIKINDLVDPDGSGAGTEVVIKIPVIHD